MIAGLEPLHFTWFLLICVLFVGFFFLEGFDFGVGLATRLLARNDQERATIIQTIGPVWDSNEVWLITAGGAMFASFPHWYATLFSGYYIPLFLILVGLIIRGVSFEFAAHSETRNEKNMWQWALFIGSLMVPFLFGMIFTSMIQGMPMDKGFNIHAGFTDYVNLMSVVGGIAVVLICYIHGLNYIRLKTDGELRQRAEAVSQKLYPVLFVGLVVFAALVYTQTDFFDRRPISTVAILAVIVIAAVLAYVGSLKGKEKLSFISTGAVLAGIVVLIFNGLFPRVMIANNPENNLMISKAASSLGTLKTMTIVTVCILPIVLAYLSWAYFIFRKRLKVGEGNEHY